MRNNALLLTFTLFLLSHALASAQPHTLVGNLQIVSVPSSREYAARTLRIWLPPSYSTDAKAHFPVLYMQDGQNCFDRATSAFDKEWQIDETLTRLISQNKIAPMIVVGIDNAGTARINEYTFIADPKDGGGAAGKYADLFLYHIKPFVEKTYRVKTDPDSIFLGGSSLGALFSLELARLHPGAFGGVIAMSPSIWWDHDAILQTDPSSLRGTRIWIDIGTRENALTTAAKNAETVDEARRYSDLLSTHGILHQFSVDQGGSHNETYWARRFPDAICYLVQK